MKKLLVGFFLAALLLPAHAFAATDAELATQLERLLKEKPEIVMDVLQNNSETVLDIVQQGSDLRRRQAFNKQWQEDMKTPKTVSLENRPFRGPENAPITLVAFSDFTCGYCQQATYTIENLLSRYPDKIRFVFKQSPQDVEISHLSSQWFLAAYRQDPTKAWTFYELLFANQREYFEKPKEVLTQVATESKLDIKALEADLKNNAKAIDTIIQQDIEDAKRLGFIGTPYFMVNDLVIRGAVPLEIFIDAVEFALNTKK